jgi:cytochrome oxidase Cu insertion factor (SCO1/SenC/PrrC family)
MWSTIRTVTHSMIKTSHSIALLAATALILGFSVGSAEGGSEMIAVGEKFVEFELPAHDGSTVNSRDLEGEPYLLFFYPKADTGG